MSISTACIGISMAQDGRVPSCSFRTLRSSVKIYVLPQFDTKGREARYREESVGEEWKV